MRSRLPRSVVAAHSSRDVSNRWTLVSSARPSIPLASTAAPWLGSSFDARRSSSVAQRFTSTTPSSVGATTRASSPGPAFRYCARSPRKLLSSSRVEPRIETTTRTGMSNLCSPISPSKALCIDVRESRIRGEVQGTFVITGPCERDLAQRAAVPGGTVAPHRSRVLLGHPDIFASSRPSPRRHWRAERHVLARTELERLNPSAGTPGPRGRVDCPPTSREGRAC